MCMHAWWSAPALGAGGRRKRCDPTGMRGHDEIAALVVYALGLAPISMKSKQRYGKGSQPAASASEAAKIIKCGAYANFTRSPDGSVENAASIGRTPGDEE
ncbi:hypothetical protein FKP32DRAFT_1589902 [Trametes sanguinea]|nr:hypothetical protein FKP32DRAFT_1589902 [Trametes sanguinea]